MSDTDNEQTKEGAQNASGEHSDNLQPLGGAARSDDETQYSVGSEGAGALPRPTWLDTSSQDSGVTDARVQSIRDIIRVRVCVICGLLSF